jgi:hypothetical protein
MCDRALLSIIATLLSSQLPDAHMIGHIFTLPAGCCLADVRIVDEGVNPPLKVLPLEVVRVWLDKYDAGTNIYRNKTLRKGISSTVPLEGYSTMAVEFDLTSICNGSGTIDDALVWDWTSLSTNATLVPSTSYQPELNTAQPSGVVTATFSCILSPTAIIYLSQHLSHKMNHSLQPKAFKIVTTDTCSSLTMEFDPPRHALLALRASVYEDALNAALNAVKDDPDSDLAPYWSLSQPLSTSGLTTVTFTFSM